MKWALRAYKAVWILGILVLAGAAGTVWQEVTLALPSVMGTNPVPVGLGFALLACVAVAYAINLGWPETHVVSVRSARRTLALLLCTAVLPLTVALCLLDLGGIGAGASFVGTFMWLLGGQLAVAALLTSRYQAMGPAVYVLLCALMGRVDGEVQLWAWPLASSAGFDAVAVGTVAFAAGVCLLLLRGLRLPVS